MSSLIPAQPDWYVRYTDGPRHRIIAWFATMDGRDDILLPFVEQDAGKPPVLYTLDRIEEHAIRITHEPAH
jgi:hypothetical protein